MEITDIRTDLRYDPKELYWIDVQGKIARIGMSPLVQESTGSFVAVQFAEAGKTLVPGASFGSTEAEKHVGQLKSPLSGVLLRCNPQVRENPRLINTDPYGAGWLAEIELTNTGAELPLLIQGEAAVRAFFESEIKKYQDKGWLAES